MAQLVVNTGGCGPLVELLAETSGGARVPACMALGFIAGQSDQLAMAVIESKVNVAILLTGIMLGKYTIHTFVYLYRLRKSDDSF